MKIIIVSFLISLIVPAIYWISGSDFIRSESLAYATCIQVVVFVAMLTFPGYPKSWKSE